MPLRPPRRVVPLRPPPSRAHGPGDMGPAARGPAGEWVRVRVAAQPAHRAAPGPHAEAHAPHAAAEGLPPADDAAERHAPRHAVGAVHGPAADAADLHLRGHVRDGGRQAGRGRQRRALAEVQERPGVDVGAAARRDVPGRHGRHDQDPQRRVEHPDAPLPRLHLPELLHGAQHADRHPLRGGLQDDRRREGDEGEEGHGDRAHRHAGVLRQGRRQEDRRRRVRPPHAEPGDGGHTPALRRRRGRPHLAQGLPLRARGAT
mmetsp:Transcript_37737/g.112072  ORF Transcript_37737/g.112072 Transcript_37737/m.112072 type:complete len:260 (-) Transcript_37737:313-1092(-)